MQDDLREIIKSLFSSNPKLTSSQISKVLGQKKVNGLVLNINRTISNDGIVKFSYDFPELNFIEKNIIDGNNKIQNKISKKILKPYYKYLKKSQSSINKVPGGLQVPKKLKERLEKIISSNIPEGMDGKVVSEYYLSNILKLDDNELQKALIQSKALQVYSKNNIFKNNRDEFENALNMINTSSRNNFYECNESLSKLNTILSDVSAEVYMSSIDLKGKNPKEIEEILQKGYYLYNEQKLNDMTYKVDEDGYRTVNVGLGKKDVLLHKNGNNIKESMGYLCKSIVNLFEKEQNLSDEEYIKKAGMLHFRYISIHPFRDSNGRTGRNLVNMLLAQRDKMFMIDRKDKSEYLAKMNEMRAKIPLKKYLNSLSSNPEICENYEENACGELTTFLAKHTYDLKTDIHKVSEKENMENWKQRNDKANGNTEINMEGR